MRYLMERLRYILPTAGRIRDFHPLECAPAGRTTKELAPFETSSFSFLYEIFTLCLSRVSCPWAYKLETSSFSLWNYYTSFIKSFEPLSLLTFNSKLAPSLLFMKFLYFVYLEFRTPELINFCLSRVSCPWAYKLGPWAYKLLPEHFIERLSKWHCYKL